MNSSRISAEYACSRGPAHAADPLPKIRPKMHEHADPPKNTKIAPNVVPKGDQKSSKIRLKSALAAFLGPGTSKKSLREGLQKYDPFLTHSGTLKSGPNIINSSKKRGSRGPQRDHFGLHFGTLLGARASTILLLGGPWGHFGGKKRGRKKTLIFTCLLFRPKCQKWPPKRHISA